MKSLLKYAPRFTNELASQMAQNLYGFKATASSLPSERDQNFLLQTETGEQFVLKIANAQEKSAMLDAENRAMAHLAEHTNLCPRLVPTRSGELMTRAKSADGFYHFVRLVTHLSGIPLGSVQRQSAGLLYDLGGSLGKVDRAMESFDHPAIHRTFHWDLAEGLNVVEIYGHLVAESELRELVERLYNRIRRNLKPLLPGLRQSAIHGDANDYNVLVGGGSDLYTRNQRVVGLVDFGDMVHSLTVADLAIAIAYAILDKPDPLVTAAPIVQGYHAEYPLKTDEIAALFDLACLRLCMSVCLAAHQRQLQPENDYLAISQQPIYNSLPKLVEIHPRLAEATFRHACQLSPIPFSKAVTDWLRARTSTFSPVLDIDLRKSPSLVFDLSVGSPLVRGDPRQNSETELSNRLRKAMDLVGATVGIGRYDEPRLLYTAPQFATGPAQTDESRVIHLGLDLFVEVGTPVYAPLAGTVQALANKTAPQDYGPVIILAHQSDDGHTFYTLYGHLSQESLGGLSVGESVAQGEPLATVGAPAVNGGWPPHLHFQLILDLLELDTDFPGVALASQRAVWCSMSPDPNLILGIPADRFPKKEADMDETLAARRALVGRNLSIAYREPLKIVRGWMQYLYDDEGRRYLDAYNNVPHVGHCHPRVVRAGQEQMAVLNTNTRYLHDFINRFAERLSAMLPDPLNVCYFVNSASEGNELALRLARAYTNARDMIVLEAAYHGHTSALIDISPYKHDGPGGIGAPLWVHTAPIPDLYRGQFKGDDPQAGEKYAQPVQEIIEGLQKRDVPLAGYIAESLPSVGGQVLFPEGYLAQVYRYVREAGGLCIADEVQTGYGRIGTHFWGFELQGVVPDIVVLGKPIGNGHPIGAVVTTPSIATAFDNGMEFFSTFGGNTVSCAIGLAVLEVVQEEKLQAHALRVGERMLAGLRPLLDRHSIVGDVRGSGLFLGVELVRNRETLEPATEEASFVVNRLREHGILLGTDGPHHNVIKIRPPMPFSEADADVLIAKLDKILREEFGRTL